jgi:hypothetical protein
VEEAIAELGFLVSMSPAGVGLTGQVTVLNHQKAGGAITIEVEWHIRRALHRQPWK